MPIAPHIREQMANASWIRRMFEEGARLKAEHPGRVVDLSLGNPDIEPPPAFQQALRAAVEAPAAGHHRYMTNAGLFETRRQVARQLAVETGAPFAADDIVMACGAAAGINVVLRSVLSPGDEVVILAPYFPEYPFYIRNFGGVVRVVETTPAFLPDIDALSAALGPRTRVVLINTPNNPTGATYPRECLQQVADALRARAPGAYLLSDEPYKRLVYDGVTHESPVGLYERTVVVGSHSKDLAIPGERIGYVAFSPEIPAPERTELVRAAAFVTRALGFVNAPALMQRVVASLQGTTVDPAIYRERRDLLVEGLTAAGYRFPRPTGAFYLFLPTPTGDDVAFVHRLAERLVLTVPGQGFGRSGHIRISYCVDPSRLKAALPAFRALAEEYGLQPG